MGGMSSLPYSPPTRAKGMWKALSRLKEFSLTATPLRSPSTSKFQENPVHNTSKSTCEDRLVHFEERKKGVHLLIFMKPPIMQVCFLVRLFEMFVFGCLPSLIL